MKIIIAPLCILCFWGLTNCGSRCLKSHAPIMPYLVYPSSDSLQIGDTLWLEAVMPHVMKDFETGEMANYGKVSEFHSGFYLYEIVDTSIYIMRGDTPLYANNKFDFVSRVGTFSQTGNLLRISYINSGDRFVFKVGVVAKDTGFFSVNLAYNPGGTTHGGPKIDMGDKKCVHRFSTLCQSINDGSSTLHRATDKGFKVWYSPGATKLEYWIYHNRMYFFQVVK